MDGIEHLLEVVKRNDLIITRNVCYAWGMLIHEVLTHANNASTFDSD